MLKKYLPLLLVANLSYGCLDFMIIGGNVSIHNSCTECMIAHVVWQNPTVFKNYHVPGLSTINTRRGGFGEILSEFECPKSTERHPNEYVLENEEY